MTRKLQGLETGKFITITYDRDLELVEEIFLENRKIRLSLEAVIMYHKLNQKTGHYSTNLNTSGGIIN